jgi:uncharacterized protein (DUF433 family)
VSKPLEILAFTADQICALTGLTHRQLRYWSATNVFRSEYDRGESNWSSVYSFCDLVSLDLLATLRGKHKVPLQELGKVSRWLREQYHRQTPWSAVRLFVGGRSVCFGEADSEPVRRAFSGLPGPVYLIDLGRMVRGALRKVQRLRKRQGHQIGRIERRRRVVHNLPVVAGTRIPTIAIWELYEAGYTGQRIQKKFPSLTQRDVEAAIAYEEDRRRFKKAS